MKSRPAARSVKQDRPDDKKIFGTWISGYTSGDVARVMSIFDQRLRYIEPCEPEQTFESLSKWYEFDFKRRGPRPTWTFETESIDIGGDLAVIVSRWMAVTDYGGFSAEVRRLRSIDFLRLGAEGWKIFRTINDPQPCGTPSRTMKRPRRR